MRSVWSCSSCAVLLLFALLAREATTSHVGRPWKDVVHRVAKAQVTAHPARRDEGTCPAEHSSCAASLGGGCCPSRYACDTDSCYATTAGPTSACGKSGYFACAATDGGGCCPVGSVCGTGGACLAPAGATYTNTNCPSSYYLCPASFNYGCCLSGMGCAPNACYSTDPVTTTITQTITTTSGTRVGTTTETAVTVATPTPPAGLTANDANIAAKFIPTTVPKVPATTPSSEPEGGLSGGAIGGIIAGVVALLIVVIVAAFFIIRRLKHVEDIIESKRGSSTGVKSKTQSQAQMEHYGRHLHSPEPDDMSMSIDPLMVPSNTSASGTPQPGVESYRARSESSGFGPSPNLFNNDRHASPDFNNTNNNPAYFDLSPRTQNFPGGPLNQPMMPAHMRASTESTTHGGRGGGYDRYAYTHWRQQSNASELSADGSENGGGPPGAVLSPRAELAGSSAASTYVELPSSDPHYHQYQQHVRNRSGSGSGGYGRQRSDSATLRSPLPMAESGSGAGTGTGVGVGVGPGPVLAPLDESAEEILHGPGYYGRRDQQAGQTGAGLGGVSGWDIGVLSGDGGGGGGGGYPVQGQGQTQQGHVQPQAQVQGHAPGGLEGQWEGQGQGQGQTQGHGQSQGWI